jgi:hypothetical protein
MGAGGVGTGGVGTPPAHLPWAGSVGLHILLTHEQPVQQASLSEESHGLQACEHPSQYTTSSASAAKHLKAEVIVARAAGRLQISQLFLA